MSIHTDVLELVLTNYGFLDDELSNVNQQVPEENFKRVLFDLKLNDWNARDLFYWEIHTEIERQIYLSYDSERVAENVTEAWNLEKEIKVNASLIQNFIHSSNLKFPNSRKAFLALCDGDLLSYKAFNGKPDLFIDLLLRYLANVCKNSMNISNLSQEISSKIFADSSRKDIQNSLRRLGFTSRTGKIIFKRIKNYKRLIGNENLVFSTGMNSILLEVLKDSEMSEQLKNLHDLLIALPSKETGELEEDGFFAEEVSQGVKPIKPEGPNEVISKKTAILLETTLVDEDSPDKEISATSVVPKGFSPLKQEAPISLESAIDSMHVTLSEVNKLFDNQRIESNNTLNQLNVAKEEIERLEIAIQQEKEKVSLAEEKAYKKILQAIGGESGNYLLSDLFEESQGNIPDNPKVSMGRLINLFSNLSLAVGLEEHSFGLSLGATFKVEKDELIKKFQIDGPIESHENEITIKLVKYGWMMNGIIIIQPLVTEVKGDS